MEIPELPSVKIHKLVCGDQCRILYVKCCYCGKEHKHGGGYLMDAIQLGSRLSHCKIAKKEYMLVL